MTEKKKRIEFSVFPLWKFIEDTFGMNQAFRQFGPYQGASIQPNIVDRNTIEVIMPLVLSNTNYVGAHFGGSLYSMCDPFFMYILMQNLGKDYIVWDKSAKIEFVSPGKGTVKALFFIPDEEVSLIKEIVMRDKKTTRNYQTEVLSEEGKLVARVEKEIYIRRNF